MNAPVEPNLVEDAPCHEIVYRDGDLLNGNGLDALPVPISSPGWDNAPYTTSSHFITKDPETGVQNMGNYRGMLKAPNRIGMKPVDRAQDRRLHALGGVEEARRADALRHRPRLSAGGLVHRRPEDAGEARRALGFPAGWSASR